MPTAWPSTPARHTDYIYVTGLARAYENGSLFVAKFDAWCTLKKLVTLGGPNNGSDNDIGRAIAVDSKGNVIVAGSTLGAFDGNASVGQRGYRRRQDHIDTSASVWSHQYGTTPIDAAYGVAVDAEDSIYVTGSHRLPQRPGS